MIDKIKNNKKKAYRILLLILTTLIVSTVIFWLEWGRWEHFSDQTSFDSIIYQGASEIYEERTFVVIDENSEEFNVSSSSIFGPQHSNFIYPHYIVGVNYSNRQRNINNSALSPTLINWRRAELTIYNKLTMEPLHTIDVLELMEESGANARDYQLTSAIPRGIYIENGDLHFEWLLETDPEKPREGRSRAPYDRGLRFNFDKGYMITTDFPRSIPRHDRLEEKDVVFQVEMSIFHRWESEDSQSFRENNGLAYIEGEGGIIFRQYRPYDIDFNIESENIKLVLDSLWERTGWHYGFQKGDTIIRVHYCYSSPYEFEEDILVFKVWSVELIYDHESRFRSLVGNYDSGTGVNAEDVLEDMQRILESF
jgi:hypothetical protein